MKKKLGVLLLVVTLTFAIVGCSDDSSSNPISSTNDEIDPPETPESLQSSSSTQSLGVSTQSSTIYDSIFNLCYQVPTLYQEVLYGNPGIVTGVNKVIKLDENKSDYKIFGTKYDIVRSTNIPNKYDSFYDVKYVLKVSGGTSVFGILYKNLSATKVSFTFRAPNDNRIVQFVYDAGLEKKAYLYQKISATDLTSDISSIVGIREDNSTRKVKTVAVIDNDTQPFILDFSGIENKSSGNTTGGLYMKVGMSTPSSSYAWQDTINNVSGEITSGPYNQSPIKSGAFKTDGTNNVVDTQDFDAPNGYPTKQEITDYHSNSAGHGIAYEVEINSDLTSPEDKSLTEVLHNKGIL
ncbi:hypothetical protein JCM16358_12010 [Halanaerocella petrolearia]